MENIYSDDPQAIEKLKGKLNYLENLQNEMKRINVGYKRHGLEWVMQNVSPETFRFYSSGLQYSWNKGKFYPAWALTNNNAVMRQVKKRIEKLEKQKL
jgi:hypothetical protein